MQHGQTWCIPDEGKPANDCQSVNQPLELPEKRVPIPQTSFGEMVAEILRISEIRWQRTSRFYFFWPAGNFGQILFQTHCAWYGIPRRSILNWKFENFHSVGHSLGMSISKLRTSETVTARIDYLSSAAIPMTLGSSDRFG